MQVVNAKRLFSPCRRIYYFLDNPNFDHPNEIGHNGFIPYKFTAIIQRISDDLHNPDLF